MRILATDLETGMVAAIGGRLGMVTSVAFANSASGPVALVETVAGTERVGAGEKVEVWHAGGEPLFVDAPPEELGPCMAGESYRFGWGPGGLNKARVGNAISTM